MKKRKSSVLIFFIVLVLLNFLNVIPGNSQKASDHAEIGRYGTSSISYQELANFNEYKLALGPVRNDSVSEILKIQGKVMMTLYQGPADASSYEIYHAYRDLLISKQYDILYSCSGTECGTAFLSPLYKLSAFAYDHGYNNSAPITQGSQDFSYLITARKSTGEKTTYVSLIVSHGWFKYPVYKLDVIEMQKPGGKISSIQAAKEDVPSDRTVPDRSGTLHEKVAGRPAEAVSPAMTPDRSPERDEDAGAVRFGFHMSADSYFGLLLRARHFEFVIKGYADLFDGFPEGYRPDDFLMIGGHISYLFRPWEKADIGVGLDLRQGISITGNIKYVQYIDAGPVLSFNYSPGKHFVISGLFYPVWLNTRETDMDDSFSLAVQIPRASVALGFLF
ncbi:MAG TPA: hypothetical protein PLO24_07175 [Bacteroidales bacterium]|jgi:hypothetical protein|nr:hypothetical protein [Bacteroidales bacterium]HOS72943.1 hypothetical protein [Bacteroidales bacterium]HQH24938.1 hypothetical protein [Bacteroidales bacterium]HQJ82342.1 hypothetical protein [Bacteroidales bacterium]